VSARASRARSLRVQLIRWLAPPLVVVLALSTAVSYLVAQRFARNAFDNALFDSVRSLGQLVAVDDDTPRLHLGPGAKALLESDPEDDVYYRVTSNERTLASNADLPLPRAIPPKGPTFFDTTVEGRAVRCAALAAVSGDIRAPATAAYCETLKKRHRLASELLVAVLLPQLLLAALGLALLSVGIRRGLAPLAEVTQAVGQRGERDLSPVPDADVPSEIAPLTRALNGLLARLGHALDAQQRFIADAAHQLRTPLAGLAAQTDRAMHETDIAAMQPALKQLRASSRRAVRLVNQLLTLARAEPGGDPRRNFHRLDLAKVVQDACAEWVPEALRAAVDLGFSGPTCEVWVEGDETLLGEMIGNLVDNAIRYGHRPGTVTVRLVTSPQIEIVVDDDGPGVPESERERIFERFHRVPGTPPGGSGLGLAIVCEIAQAHGAEVRLEAGEGGRGSAFRVVFGGGRRVEPKTGGRVGRIRGKPRIPAARSSAAFGPARPGVRPSAGRQGEGDSPRAASVSARPPPLRPPPSQGAQGEDGVGVGARHRRIGTQVDTSPQHPHRRPPPGRVRRRDVAQRYPTVTAMTSRWPTAGEGGAATKGAERSGRSEWRENCLGEGQANQLAKGFLFCAATVPRAGLRSPRGCASKPTDSLRRDCQLTLRAASSAVGRRLLRALDSAASRRCLA
jgi:two-component system sensor histidine kinase TctE